MESQTANGPGQATTLGQTPQRVPLLAGRPGTVRGLGYDERWLQDWLAADPSRLGLGDVSIIDQEQIQTSGGLLDLLALDPGSDTYYSIEVQLGEIDGSHSFRVFDYWARNRARIPGKTHVAVLMAENASGRFRPALEALAETVPLIVIELHCWRGQDEALLISEIVIANESLDLSDTPAAATSEERTESDWLQEASDEAWAFKDAFVDWVTDNLGEVRVDYKPKSYIGVRVGRRTWAPLWLRQDGAAVYLPDPDGSRSDDPSVAFERFEARLRDEGLSVNWQPSYNAKANPVVIRLRRGDLERAVVQELLRASYEILRNGAQPWTERQQAAGPDSPVKEAEPQAPAPGAPGTRSADSRL
ncbi:MAG: hypothetical protein ACR2MA_04185 [Egibacteraceae bacterium]